MADQSSSLEGDANLSSGKTEEKSMTEEADGELEDLVCSGKDVKQDSSTDPFSYIKGDQFTSEIYKIEIKNLPRRFGMGELKKRIQSLGLKPSKIKAVDKGHFAFVTFKSEADRDEAIKVLSTHVWKGQVLTVKFANPTADPFLKRKLEAENRSQKDAKVSKLDPGLKSDISSVERLNHAVTPFFNIEYSEQIKKKHNNALAFIHRLEREVSKNNYGMRPWIEQQKKENNGLFCNLHPLIPSPQEKYYRNKNEFTIGCSPEGEDKTVGFRQGSYRSGTVSVVEPTHCVHLSQLTKDVCKVIQEYLKQHSSYSAFNPETREGNWRLATVRTNLRNDVLVILGMHPQKLTQEEIDAEKEKVKTYFTSGEGKGGPITSIYFIIQKERREGDEDLPCEHLFGEEYIEEKLLGLTFRISPLAFFQVNTVAAELLYSKIGEWCDIGVSSALLDICCGTGTIGLTMAKRVTKVVGIEMCKGAVEDAKMNATINGITNARFSCGKAETVLPTLIYGLRGQDVVAVVDPPRGGLHPDVVRAIRKCSFVKHLVYVSCNPNGALPNLVDFTRSTSKRVHGPAFRVIQAVAVDLFPQTEHCEMIFMLKREEINRQKESKTVPTTSPSTTDASDVAQKIDDAQKMDSSSTDVSAIPVTISDGVVDS